MGSSTELAIDIETYSSANLAECGVYRYAEEGDFQILLFGFSLDGGEARTVDLASGERIPPAVLSMLTDDSVIKRAYNAHFERVCLSRFLGMGTGEYLSPASWRCDMVWAATLGLPLSLKDCGAALGIARRKMDEGKPLVRLFCSPCRPTKANGGRTRNMPSDDPERWAVFKEYNKRDVEAELDIERKLSPFPPPKKIWDQYAVDQEINDRGVACDLALAERAMELDSATRAQLLSEMRSLTEIENPNSPAQVKKWLSDSGVEAPSIGKRDAARIAGENPGTKVAEAMSLRLMLAKSSIRKYKAMRDTACSDGRVRGMFQFYGTHTGRFAGRHVQLQNLPQNKIPDLALARSLVRDGRFGAFPDLFEAPEALSQLIRTAFVPAEGMRLVVSDYSAIEARVIAWLAGERWRMEAFAADKDIYCESASQMFGVPVIKHGVNGSLRQKGKIAELALGYGGGVGALKAMGALEMGLTEGELQPLVDAWRATSPAIVRLWRDVGDAAMACVKTKSRARGPKGIAFSFARGILFASLPSGRSLAYPLPRIGFNDFGEECVTYMGSTAKSRWERIGTYGPKLVENIVQALARDVLCEAMVRMRGLRVVMHIHDELVIEAPPSVTVGAVSSEMSVAPDWAPGLVLRADGYECPFYMKD